jgi:hypothetical protein
MILSPFDMEDDQTYGEQEACKATVEQVAILDKEGNVQLVNQGWAEGSQGTCLFVRGIREGDNFFSSLHTPHCIPEIVMEEIKQAIRDVLAHTRPEYSQEYVFVNAEQVHNNGCKSILPLYMEKKEELSLKSILPKGNNRKNN